ncbi:MAG: DoxX family protein [Chlamydiales bacterium]
MANTQPILGTREQVHEGNNKQLIENFSRFDLHSSECQPTDSTGMMRSQKAVLVTIIALGIIFFAAGLMLYGIQQGWMGAGFERLPFLANFTQHHAIVIMVIGGVTILSGAMTYFFLSRVYQKEEKKSEKVQLEQGMNRESPREVQQCSQNNNSTIHE